MHLLVATTNKGKLREFERMLSQPGSDLTFSDLSAFPPIEPVEETGDSFRENAFIKASYYAKATGQWAMADDSGLQVDGLNSGPGVHSARWAAMHKAGSGDAANNALLLEQLKNLPDERRVARFMCFLALAAPTGEIAIGVCDSIDGVILREPRGANGFGYDPLFLVRERGLTMAELSPDEKHSLSHRGRALAQFREVLKGFVYNADGKAAVKAGKSF